jgi:putative transposase
MDRMRGFRQWPWHLNEVYVRIKGALHYLWHAVDHECGVLEAFVTKKCDNSAALAFMKKTLKRHDKPEVIVTGGLRSYLAAMGELGNLERHDMGRWLNNRLKNSHLPFRRREQAKLRFSGDDVASD